MGGTGASTGGGFEVYQNSDCSAHPGCRTLRARMTPPAAETTWFASSHPEGVNRVIAYFSAEFALSESIPIYSGGLGVLAGDHLKAANDLGVPLVGVGLAYKEGYFKQEIGPDGSQTESYLHNDFNKLPLELETDESGLPRLIEVPIPEGVIRAQIWRVDVGSVPLYLLDSDIEANNEHHRRITHRLYGGNNETRILQEILLGIGGVKALGELGIRPEVFHINEGHAAFLLMERLRFAVQARGLGLEEAKAWIARTSVFTTHTPVAAGFDLFPPELMHKYFDGFAEDLGTSWQELLAWGQEHPENPDDPFNMALFALRYADHRNGVSRLHGQVARAMWKAHWPDCPPEEVPIGHITNGVHLRNWVSVDMASVLDRYLGPAWSRDPDEVDWRRVGDIPDRELWEAHCRGKDRLIRFVRERIREQRRRWGESEDDTREVDSLLDPDTLTVGFARRFAPYKRATLLLRDRTRLQTLVQAADRPVQFVFAGKSHPANHEGKLLIQQIVQLSMDEAFRGRVVFLENYDMSVGRHLVQGVDVWLNTPRRPLEASGTSGMKGAVNGVLNVSVLDGWWDEGYRPEAGWAIGDDVVDEDEDEESRDARDSAALYRVLEEEVVPRFYERDGDDLPLDWIRMMKASLTLLVPVFSSHRMVKEYVEKYYLQAGGS